MEEKKKKVDEGKEKISSTSNESKKEGENTKTESAKKEISQATKVETKPVNNGHVTIKSSKHSKKGQFGLILLILLIICISVFLINVFRKYAILVDLSKKANEYVTNENYHVTAIYERDFTSDGFTKIETYRKGNVAKSIMNSPTKGVITQIDSTTAGSKMFMDGKQGKIMTYNNDNKMLMPAVSPQDMIGEAKFFNSLFTGIQSEELDGVDCYVLDNKSFMYGLWSGEPRSYKIYIDKETGLTKQLEQEEVVEEELQTLIIKYSYQFDSVTDNDLRAPSDISEYIIQNN